MLYVEFVQSDLDGKNILLLTYKNNNSSTRRCSVIYNGSKDPKRKLNY